MAHYIDANRLREELQKPKTELKVGNYYLDNSEQAVGYENALIDFELLIDSLQQDEKAVELEMCSQAYWEERGWMMIPPDVTLKGIESLLEQVRKKLQQEQPQVADASKMEQPVEGLEELRKEVINFSQDHFDELHSDMETIDIVHIIARHFAEWGAEHARKEK